MTGGLANPQGPDRLHEGQLLTDRNPDPSVRGSESSPKVLRETWLVGLIVGFIVWAGVFISRSAFHAPDGHVYFSLFDDAMIAMRYAWNLAHGYGLVWNVGERVEGYTSLLMVLAMTPFSALIEDKRLAVLAVQLAGIPTLLAIIFLTRAVLRRLSDSATTLSTQWMELLLIGATLLFYPLVYFTLMGMETGLLTLLLLASVLLAYRAADGRRPRDLIAMSLALGLAYLTRPDALIAAILIYIAVAARWIGGRRGLREGRWLIVAALLFLVFPLSQLAFRWSYYGSLVPNTYTLKVEGFPLAIRLRNGFAYIRPFLGESLLFSILAGLALTLDFSWKRLLVVILFASSVAYTIYVGGDAWRNWRFVAPYFPLVLGVAILELGAIVAAMSEALKHGAASAYLSRNTIWRTGWSMRAATLLRRRAWFIAIPVGLLLIGLALIADPLGISGPGFGDEQAALMAAGVALLVIAFGQWARRTGRTSRGDLEKIAVAVIFLGGVMSIDFRFLPEMVFLRPPFDVEGNRERIRIAIAINELTTGKATVGVLTAGVIPYYTGLTGVDFLGKTDPRIAALPADISGAVGVGSMVSRPGHNKYDLDYSIGKVRPTYVQQFKWGSDNLCPLLGDVYLPVDYGGARLYFLKDSPLVRWPTVAEKGTIPSLEGACSRTIP